MNYIDEIADYIPKNEQEVQDKKVILDCMRLFPDNILLRQNELAHITSSGFIVNKALNKALMIHHNIRNTWAWTGGHADGNGNLLEVAVQEALEETGLCTVPLSHQIASLDVLTVSGHTKRGQYVNSHLHLSVAYILLAEEDIAPTVKPDENSAVVWFPVEKISVETFAQRDVYLYTKLLGQARAWAHGYPTP